MRLTIILLIVTFGFAFCQEDKIFTKPVYFLDTIHVTTIMFDDNTSLETALTGGDVLWDNILERPSVFNPDLTITDPRYKPMDWQPTGIFLDDYLDQLGYMPIPQKTTAEIESKVLPEDKAGIVLDVTLGVYKIWVKDRWKIIITGN